MAEIQHLYSEPEIARVRRLLEMASQSGNPQAFEINCDGYRLVHRTTSLDQFDEGLTMLPENFNTLEVKIFYGSANVNDNHQFVRQPRSQPQQEQPLSGAHNQQQTQQSNLDWVDARLKEGIAAERARWTSEQLEKENRGLKDEITRKEDYIAKLEGALLESNKGFNWNQLEGVVTTGAKMLGAVMGKSMPANLAGAPQPDSQQTSDAEFEEEEEISEFEKHLRALIEQVNNSFNTFQARMFISLLEEAVLHPALLPDVLKFLRSRIYNKRNPNRRQQQHQRHSRPMNPPQTGNGSQHDAADSNDDNDQDYGNEQNH